MSKRGVLVAAAAAGAAYWASRQPGGIPGTWSRFRQGLRDIGAGQNPLSVGKRFLAGHDEEPAGLYAEEPATEPEVTGFQQPYQDYVTSG